MRLHRSRPRYIYAKEKKELFRIQTHRARLERILQFNRLVRSRLANDQLRLEHYNSVCRHYRANEITRQEFMILLVYYLRFYHDLLQLLSRLISPHRITIGPESVTFHHQNGEVFEISTRRSNPAIQAHMVERFRQRNNALLRRR